MHSCIDCTLMQISGDRVLTVSNHIYGGPYYEAAGKWSKVGWCVLLAVALALTAGDFSGLLGLASVVAAIVYLVDVRPAVRALKPGSGPYG